MQFLMYEHFTNISHYNSFLDAPRLMVHLQVDSNETKTVHVNRGKNQ